MRKYLFILMATLLLVACGNTKMHENIDEGMAKDTEQIISIMDKFIDEDRDLTDKELDVFEHYNSLYGSKQKTEELTEEENRLYLLVGRILDNPELYYTLESDKDKFENDTKRIINNVIETGEIYD